MTKDEKRAVRALCELGWKVGRIARGLKLPLVDVAPVVAAEERKVRRVRELLEGLVGDVR